MLTEYQLQRITEPEEIRMNIDWKKALVGIGAILTAGTLIINSYRYANNTENYMIQNETQQLPVHFHPTTNDSGLTDRLKGDN